VFVQEETFFDVYWKGSAGKRDTVRGGSDQSMKKVSCQRQSLVDCHTPRAFRSFSDSSNLISIQHVSKPHGGFADSATIWMMTDLSLAQLPSAG